MARPLVVAHRGSSHLLAEHTLNAYLRAIKEGADGLECDVRLTRDGHLVCVHDRRVDRTSDGHGIVSEFDLDDLHGLDFGSWKLPPAGVVDVEARDAAASPTPVLILERLLEVVVDAGRPIHLLIETKHPTRYAGLVEQKLVRLLNRFGLAGAGRPDGTEVSVMSFATVGLRRIRLLAPNLRTALLLDRLPLVRRDGSLPAGVRAAAPGLHVVRTHPEYVERVHARGHSVYVWTVDEAADVELMLALDVDAIITNRPADVLTQLHQAH